MRALSIRQPFAELILRGIKTVEYRRRTTCILGERFYIYASKKLSVVSCQLPVKMWSDDLVVARPAEWMVELAEQVGMIEPGELAGLPTGVIVGSAVIESVSQVQDVGGYKFAWHLMDVRREKKLRKPSGHPQPVWFHPFN